MSREKEIQFYNEVMPFDIADIGEDYILCCNGMVLCHTKKKSVMTGHQNRYGTQNVAYCPDLIYNISVEKFNSLPVSNKMAIFYNDKKSFPGLSCDKMATYLNMIATKYKKEYTSFHIYNPDKLTPYNILKIMKMHDFVLCVGCGRLASGLAVASACRFALINPSFGSYAISLNEIGLGDSMATVETGDELISSFNLIQLFLNSIVRV